MCRYNLTRTPPPIHSTKMTDITDDAKRRAYWAEQMEAGYELVQRILPFEVEECGEGLANIHAAAEAGGVEMLFSDSKIVDDLDRIFYIREGLVEAVVAIGRDMNARGWVLKIEDGYRTRDMQTRLGRKPEVFDAIVQKCAWARAFCSVSLRRSTGCSCLRSLSDRPSNLSLNFSMSASRSAMIQGSTSKSWAWPGSGWVRLSS